MKWRYSPSPDFILTLVVVLAFWLFAWVCL